MGPKLASCCHLTCTCTHLSCSVNGCYMHVHVWLFFKYIACEQALLGVGAGGGKRRELATMSQEFSFLHQIFQCKMLIGGY